MLRRIGIFKNNELNIYRYNHNNVRYLCGKLYKIKEKREENERDEKKIKKTLNNFLSKNMTIISFLLHITLIYTLHFIV